MKGKVTPPTEESVSYKVTCETKNVEITNTNEVTSVLCGDETVGTCDICEEGHDMSMVDQETIITCPSSKFKCQGNGLTLVTGRWSSSFSATIIVHTSPQERFR